MKNFIVLLFLTLFIGACHSNTTTHPTNHNHTQCDTMKHDSCCIKENMTHLGGGKSVGTSH